jgi:hypothetical protein
LANSSLRPTLPAAALALPALAYANAGIGAAPFIGLSVATVPALALVIPLEAAILRLAVPAGFPRLLWLSLFANVLSTVLGAAVGVVLTLVSDVLFLRGFGLAGLVLGLLVMYAATAAIEYAVLRRKLVEPPRPVLLRAVCIANAISYVLIAGWAYFAFVHMDTTVPRSRMYEALNVAIATRSAAVEQYQSSGRFFAHRQDRPTANTRTVSLTEKGLITVEIHYPPMAEVNGKTLVMEPEIREGRILAWHCYVPEAPLRFFPPGCRFRSAAESAAATEKK